MFKHPFSVFSVLLGFPPPWLSLHFLSVRFDCSYRSEWLIVFILPLLEQAVHGTACCEVFRITLYTYLLIRCPLPLRPNVPFSFSPLHALPPTDLPECSPKVKLLNAEFPPARPTSQTIILFRLLRRRRCSTSSLREIEPPDQNTSQVNPALAGRTL